MSGDTAPFSKKRPESKHASQSTRIYTINEKLKRQYLRVDYKLQNQMLCALALIMSRFGPPMQQSCAGIKIQLLLPEVLLP